MKEQQYKYTFEEAVIDTWNVFAIRLHIPTVRLLTDLRRKAIKNRMKENAFNLQDIFDEIKRSDFLLGKKTQWVVTFDFVFCSANNYLKILEGNYRNKKIEGTSKFPQTTTMNLMPKGMIICPKCKKKIGQEWEYTHNCLED